ncbi:M20 AcylaseI like [Drosophila suzukii associated hytrosavirus 1]|nr:M20 AcylaseI like [Drosophila suzukii associated hytrosavirus 1]
MDIDWTKELQAYIRIDTSHPNVNYTKAIEFLVDLIKRIDAGLVYRVYNNNSYPLMIVSKPGKTSRGILLNSHMDVVNASNIEDWTYLPFSGYYEPSTDRIYGRGTQDMKSQGIQYLALLHRLKSTKLDYTIHVSFVPNEEIGGIGGLSEFVRTPEFRSLHIEFVMDESCASPFQHFLIFFAERTIWQFKIKIRSGTGHSAMPLNNTCEIKLKRLLDEIAQFRRRDLETNIVKRHEPKIGYSTTINMTRIHGGELLNVLPREIDVYFDMRIGLEMSLNTMFDEIQRWTLTANNGQLPTEDNSVSIEWIKRSTKSQETDMRNNMCTKFLSFFQDNKIPYALTIAPGSTDGRFLRDEGLPVLGFTPINMTPPLLHSTNEYIYKKQFLHNIDLMTKIIKYMATM